MPTNLVKQQDLKDIVHMRIPLSRNDLKNKFHLPINVFNMINYINHYGDMVIALTMAAHKDVTLLAHYLIMTIISVDQLVNDRPARITTLSTSLKKFPWRRSLFCLVKFYNQITGMNSASPCVEIGRDNLRRVLECLPTSRDDPIKLQEKVIKMINGEMNEYYWQCKHLDIKIEMRNKIHIINDLTALETPDLMIALKVIQSVGELLYEQPTLPNLEQTNGTVLETMKNLRNTISHLTIYPNLKPILTHELIDALKLLCEEFCSDQQGSLTKVQKKLEKFHDKICTKKASKLTVPIRPIKSKPILEPKGRQPNHTRAEVAELVNKTEMGVVLLSAKKIIQLSKQIDISTEKGFLAFQMMFIIFYEMNKTQCKQSKSMRFIRNSFAHYDPVTMHMKFIADEEFPPEAEVSILHNELCKRRPINGYVNGNDVMCPDMMRCFNWVLSAIKSDHTTEQLIDTLIKIKEKNGKTGTNEKRPENLSNIVTKFIVEEIDEFLICTFITTFINDFSDFNAKGLLGRTALHVACIEGKCELVNVLNKNPKKIDVNLTDDFGNTAFHYACMRGHKKIIDVLKKKNAKELEKNTFQSTAAHYAILSENAHAIIDEFKLNGDKGDSGNLSELPIIDLLDTKLLKKLEIY